MANPNIVNVTTIYGNTATQVVSTTAANIVQNAASSNQVYKINSLSVSNINTVSSAVSLEINVAGSNTFIVRNVVVPANSMINIIGKDTSIYLLENSSLQLTAAANSVMQAVCSWEQIS